MSSDPAINRRLAEIAAERAKLQAEFEMLTANQSEGREEKERDEETRRRFDRPGVIIGGHSTPVEYPQPSQPTVPTALYPGPYPFANKIVIPPFRGDSSDFCRFERDLKMLLEPNYSDDARRYLMLQQLCEKDAKLAVTNCFGEPAGTRYEKAVDQLRSLFGRPHMIATRVLNELLLSVKGSYEGAEAMSRLALRMKDAQITLAPTSHAGDLDATDTLNRIVKALPLECRIKWAHKTAKRQLSGIRASFHDLYCFVKVQADVRLSQYGGFMQSEDNEKRETRLNSETASRVSGRPNTTYGGASPRECPVWFMRFRDYVSIMKKPTKGAQLNIGLPTMREIRLAELNLLRFVQQESYNLQTEDKGTRRVTVITEHLKRLNPVMVNNLICVDSRVIVKNETTQRRYPVILPKAHHLTELLIQHYHKMEGHAGSSQVLAAIRRKYWIVQGYAAVKRIVGRCFLCRKAQAKTLEQIMAPLPAVRTTAGWFPFKTTGVDYFGPINIKHGRRKEKRYGCLFTCLQTRAVHLEVAQSLSTDSFIMALKRFIARRGSPEEFFSDNGSNFKGAEREIGEALKALSRKKIQDTLTDHGAQWTFQPPCASHRGGVWERIIRSIKRIMRSVTHEQTMTDEVLDTLMAEAERTLNNRPLVPVRSDDMNHMALTPNDLLLLRPTLNTVVPESTTERYIKG